MTLYEEVMLVPILVMEFRGFSKMATEMSCEITHLGISPARIRASAIEVVKKAVAECAPSDDFANRMHLGGDTWYWTSPEIKECYNFGLRLIRYLFRLSNENGLYYLKPSIALGFGEPKFQGERFLDDDSIGSYLVSDKGSSFVYFAVGAAIPELRAMGGVALIEPPPRYAADPNVRAIDWQNTTLDGDEPDIKAIEIPALLLDSEVRYAESTSSAVTNLIRYQRENDTAQVFGGPVPLHDEQYKEYVKQTISLLKAGAGARFTVLSYLPLNEPSSSIAWLELCRKLTVLYRHRFAFAAFTIPEGQLRPMSFHVYGQQILHIGLRAYSAHQGTATMSSSITLRNAKIAARFSSDFIENFRKIGPLDDFRYSRLLESFPGLDASSRARIMRTVDGLTTQ
jgi:hypothetical protein